MTNPFYSTHRYLTMYIVCDSVEIGFVQNKEKGVRRLMKIAIVADDTAEILRVVAKQLERLGYAVRAYPNGSDAINGLKEAMAEGERIALLVTDLEMPGGPNGIAVARSARALFPNCRRVLMTGSLSQIPVEWADAIDRLLRKPFTLEDVRRLLCDRGSSEDEPPAPVLLAHGFGRINP